MVRHTDAAAKQPLAQVWMESRRHLMTYDHTGRTNFINVLAMNWGDAVTKADEDLFIERSLKDSFGVFVDVGCGTGKWTTVVCDAIGVDRVIGLDLSVPMLKMAGNRIRHLTTIRGSALELPFCADSLGGVICYNALQLFADPARSISEAFRCLRPGGKYICFTFETADDAGYRWFQRSWERAAGVRSFHVQELRGLFEKAGFLVRRVKGDRLTLFLEATKPE